MKKNEIINICSGILLVLLAAFFSVALLVQFMGVGVSNARISVFFRIGLILKSVYGSCSILIPIFLFAAACSAFSSAWNLKKGVSLLLSFFPFFTLVLAERICRTMAYYEEGPLVKIKIVFTLIISLGIVIIEYLFFSILGQKLTRSIREKNQGVKKIVVNNVVHKIEKIPGGEKTVVANPANPKEQKAQSENGTQIERSTAENIENMQVEGAEGAKENSVQISPVFSHVFDNLPKTEGKTITEKINEKIDEEIASKKENALALSKLADVSEKEREKESDSEQEQMPEANPDDMKEPEVVDSAEEDEDGSSFGAQNISSLITQEEFDALTQPLTEEELAEEDAMLAEDEAESQVIEDSEIKSKEYSEIEKSGQAKIDESEKTENAEKSEKTLPPDFFDVDLNEEDDDEENDETANTVNFRGVSDVFADMDADVREENGLPSEKIELADKDSYDEDSESDAQYKAQSKAQYEPEYEADETELYQDSDEAESEQTDGNLAQEEETDFEQEEFIEEPMIESESEEDSEPSEPVFDERESDRENHLNEKEKWQAQSKIPVAPARRKGPYKIPIEGILSEYDDKPYWLIDDQTRNASLELKETLSEFKIDAEIIGIRKGPVVTMFEILPAPGVKLSKIAALQDNIALRLAASSVRIVAPIPGKQAVGIEVPNKDRAIVSFREIIEKDAEAFKKMKVPVILGKDIEGEPQIIDLVKTPHLLIAGATGAGKSVCVNSMILSILYKRSPQEVKLILIDPKIVELKLYNDIPHLLTPVITEPKKAFQALQYCLCEMERRYALLDGMGVRDISNYNKRIEERHIATEKLPYIVVVIDEFADLMATTGKELESTIARLAAMSRAIGIHIVLATQRPSIDVITGLIKANIPSRIAFMVASKTDSRIIIDQVGAEKLLGRGDMLYASAVDPFPIRIQGTFISDNEVESVVDCVREYGPPEYIDEEIFVEDDDDIDDSPGLFGDGADPLYDQALEIVVQAGKASASYIQRRLKIGYNRAARLVEEMEERGIVGPQNGSKPREIIHMP